MGPIVYRDSADWLRNGVQSGHMICDDLELLHAIAARLGLAARYWIGDALTPHYQLPSRLQADADALGVRFLERKDFLRQVGRINAALGAQKRLNGKEKPEPSAGVGPGLEPPATSILPKKPGEKGRCPLSPANPATDHQPSQQSLL